MMVKVWIILFLKKMLGVLSFLLHTRWRQPVWPSLLLASLAILIGLPVRLWSAGKFVGGAASVANHFGVSPLLIGMLIIGFGTSAPEIIVSIFAAIQGNSGIAIHI